MNTTNMNNTALNLPENVEAALCYLLGFITGIVFYILEPKNPLIKFHAMQSIITFGILFLAGVFVAVLPYYLWVIGSVIWMIEIVLWLILVIKAYQGEKFKLPIIGDISEQMANKQ